MLKRKTVTWLKLTLNSCNLLGTNIKFNQGQQNNLKHINTTVIE